LIQVLARSLARSRSSYLTLTMEAIVRQKISLRCCITLRRIGQACRGPACDHAAAFFRNAVVSIGDPGSSSLRCPVCDKLFATGALVVDVPFTMFLSQEPTASHAFVTRGADGKWRYRVAAREAPCSGTGAAAASSRESRPGSEAPRSGTGAAAASSRKRRPGSEWLGSSFIPVSDEPPNVGLPTKLSVQERAARRTQRKEQKQRQLFLRSAKAELVRRALMEETPPGADPDDWSVG